jgi:hypothetical protein
MEGENNQDQVNNNKELEIAASPSLFQQGVALITMGVDKISRGTEKINNPYKYVTSDESKHILRLATQAFRDTNSEEAIKSFRYYKAKDNEPAHATGDLYKKIYHREYAYNKALDQFLNNVLNEIDPIKKGGHETSLKNFLLFGQEYIEPAMQEKKAMLIRVYKFQNNNNNN